VGFIIGPEGGFTDAEIASCLAADVVGINLGPRILRTETAGITVIALAQNLWGDL
jgi:16S rRNA (uracil1498-N3)-methyltransferase